MTPKSLAFRLVAKVAFVGAVGVVVVIVGASKGFADSPVLIAAGPAGQTYHDFYGANLKSLMGGFRVTVRKTEGSKENLEMLAEGSADIGFAQRDVYRDRLREDPKRFGRVGIVGRLSDECLFIAFRKDGPVRDASGFQKDLDGRKPLLAVGKSGSGTHETWRIVTKLEPSYAATAIRFTSGTLAINHLSAGMIEGVAWVTDPTNKEHKLLLATLADDSLGVMGISDASLTDDADDYQARTFTVPGSSSRFKEERFDTICTQSMIFTRDGIRPRVAGRVSDVLSLERDKLFGAD